MAGENHGGEQSMEEPAIGLIGSALKNPVFWFSVSAAGTVVIYAKGKDILDGAEALATDHSLMGLKDLIEAVKGLLGT